MRHTFSFNVSAVILQRDPFEHGWQRVKLERDRQGRVLKCVLQPLRMQGVESVDDGLHWMTLLPDQHVIIERPSPVKDRCEARFRMHLARRNYDISMGDRTSIAGRIAVCVVAVPHNHDLKTRRYFLDEQTSFPLKLEVVDGNSVKVPFMTLAVSYPAVMDTSVFKLPEAPGMKHRSDTAPQRVKDASEAVALLGFQPVMPRSVPFGFHVMQMQVDSHRDWRSLAVRMTDGLARATVYEFRHPEHRHRHEIEHSSHIDVAGIRLLLIADINQSAREKMLWSFAHSIQQALRFGGQVVPGREPRTDLQTLAIIERPQTHWGRKSQANR